jgi:hypothetical protein
MAAARLQATLSAVRLPADVIDITKALPTAAPK